MHALHTQVDTKDSGGGLQGEAFVLLNDYLIASVSLQTGEGGRGQWEREGVYEMRRKIPRVKDC